MSLRELRTASRPIELRKSETGTTAAGYAAVFNAESSPIYDMFREIIKPGAFARSLSDGSDIVALYGHEMNDVLGRTSAGTLKLSEDATGLAFEIALPDTSLGRDVATLLQRGDLKGASFGFRTRSATWPEAKSADGLPIRELLDVELIEISLTAFPAYPDTSAALRDMYTAQLSYWRRKRAERILQISSK